MLAPSAQLDSSSQLISSSQLSPPSQLDPLAQPHLSTQSNLLLEQHSSAQPHPSSQLCPSSQLKPFTHPSTEPHPSAHPSAKLPPSTNLSPLLQAPSCPTNQSNSEQNEDPVMNVHIPCFGDQLTRVRMAGAKNLRAGAHSPKDKFEHLYPFRIVHWHFKKSYLKVNYN